MHLLYLVLKQRPYDFIYTRTWNACYRDSEWCRYEQGKCVCMIMTSQCHLIAHRAYRISRE